MMVVAAVIGLTLFFNSMNSYLPTAATEQYLTPRWSLKQEPADEDDSFFETDEEDLIDAAIPTFPPVDTLCNQDMDLMRDIISKLQSASLGVVPVFRDINSNWGMEGTLLSMANFTGSSDRRQLGAVLKNKKSEVISAATSGKLFLGEKVRKFNRTKKLNAIKSSSNEMPNTTCTNWAVVTTIFDASDAIKRIASLADWCMVVVADLKTASKEDYGVDCHFLTPISQKEIFPEFANALPWNHFGRKNIGFAYAVKMGAVKIWDFDDDNDGLVNITTVFNDLFVSPCIQKSSVLNPYMFFGVNETVSWPRGFPLDKILDPNSTPKMCATTVKDDDVYVYQSLANMQPDVDGIYRLTRKTPFDFLTEEKRSIVMPINVSTPFNAQATLWNKAGFHLLMIPSSVHGRVADIWRSYFAQYIMKHTEKKHLVFTKPYVVQDRNAHNYLGDFQSEIPLYLKATALVSYLDTRPYDPSLPPVQSLVMLYIDLYERDFIEESDIFLIGHWARIMGYKDLFIPSKSSRRNLGAISTATSGKLFGGEIVRRFEDLSILQSVVSTQSRPLSSQCKNWAVVTTIFTASDAINRIAGNKDWCMVVVADLKTASEKEYGVKCHFLTPDSQKQLFPEFAEVLPWNHFGRKNLGFIYAIKMGALKIWDFDDDNDGLIDMKSLNEDTFVTPCSKASSVLNPYIHFGVNETACWPRGFPLDKILDPNSTPKMCTTTVKDDDVYVYQSLANMQPDVDGIYRLTRKTPFDFLTSEKRSLVIPSDVFTPFNAQATLWNKAGFHLMMLPSSVHGRVADIWRSYFAQYIMAHTSKKKLVFTKPYVVQDRNAHNYLGDFQSELPLYLKATRLVDYLSSRPYDNTHDELDNLQSLYGDLYERNFIEHSDVLLVAHWIELLRVVPVTKPSTSTTKEVIVLTPVVSIVTPVVSIVLAADKAGDLARSLQQFTRFAWKIKVEVIVVEWNYEDGTPHLQDHPSIKESLLNLGENVVVRFVSVPSKLALKQNKKGQCTFFEGLAQNVGLQRSSGKWKLVSNSNSIFSIETLSFLNSKLAGLDKNGIYTLNESSDFTIPKDFPFDSVIPVDASCKIKQSKRKPPCVPEVQLPRDSEETHGFTLVHGDSIHWLGAFLEIPNNYLQHSEFILRSIYVSGLRSFVLGGCSVCSTSKK